MKEMQRLYRIMVVKLLQNRESKLRWESHCTTEGLIPGNNRDKTSWETLNVGYSGDAR